MTEHSPLPWHVGKTEARYIYDAKGEGVANAYEKDSACLIVSAVNQASLVEELVEALEMRQCYMCCYPPEPCERCLADAALLRRVREAKEAPETQHSGPEGVSGAGA